MNEGRCIHLDGGSLAFPFRHSASKHVDYRAIIALGVTMVITVVKLLQQSFI